MRVPRAEPAETGRRFGRPWDDRVRRLIEREGAILLYLPAYSYDFNPIEMAFNEAKATLERLHGTDRDAPEYALRRAFPSTRERRRLHAPLRLARDALPPRGSTASLGVSDLGARSTTGRGPHQESNMHVVRQSGERGAGACRRRRPFWLPSPPLWR